VPRSVATRYRQPGCRGKSIRPGSGPYCHSTRRRSATRSVRAKTRSAETRRSTSARVVARGDASSSTATSHNTHAHAHARTRTRAHTTAHQRVRRSALDGRATTLTASTPHHRRDVVGRIRRPGESPQHHRAASYPSRYRFKTNSLDFTLRDVVTYAP